MRYAAPVSADFSSQHICVNDGEAGVQQSDQFRPSAKLTTPESVRRVAQQHSSFPDANLPSDLRNLLQMIAFSLLHPPRTAHPRILRLPTPAQATPPASPFRHSTSPRQSRQIDSSPHQWQIHAPLCSNSCPVEAIEGGHESRYHWANLVSSGAPGMVESTAYCSKR
jgi:hypothetical protein